jgi:hypothetical protein
MAATDAATTSEGEGVLQKSNSERSTLRQETSPGSHRHRVKPHLVDGEARLGVASILARQDGD